MLMMEDDGDEDDEDDEEDDEDDEEEKIFGSYKTILKHDFSYTTAAKLILNENEY